MRKSTRTKTKTVPRLKNGHDHHLSSKVHKIYLHSLTNLKQHRQEYSGVLLVLSFLSGLMLWHKLRK